MKVTAFKLVLTNSEKELLAEAAKTLEEIADGMDRAISVPYTPYSDEEVYDAVEVIKSLLGIRE